MKKLKEILKIITLGITPFTTTFSMEKEENIVIEPLTSDRIIQVLNEPFLLQITNSVTQNLTHMALFINIDVQNF